MRVGVRDGVDAGNANIFHEYVRDHKIIIYEQSERVKYANREGERGGKECEQLAELIWRWHLSAPRDPAADGVDTALGQSECR